MTLCRCGCPYLRHDEPGGCFDCGCPEFRILTTPDALTRSGTTGIDDDDDWERM